MSQVLLSPLWHPRNPKLRETILNSRQNDNKLFFTIQHWMSNEGFSFINSLGNSLNVAICSGFNTNYKLSNEGFSIITSPKNSLNVAICCYMLWFHYQEWSQETSKDRTTCQKCWAMHDDEFEDVDDQSDEDNGSGQIFLQVRTTCPIVPFWVSTCRNIHWCPTNLVTLIFLL